MIIRRILSVALQINIKIMNESSPKSFRKSTPSKWKAQTTAILGNSIIKDIYGNIITKSVNIQNTFLSNIFWGKIVDMNLYLKSIREKSTAKTKIHVGTNEPEDKANNILNHLRLTQTKQLSLVFY